MGKPNGNIIVLGAPRSGKTTLCRRVALETGASHQSVDALVTSFQTVFPSLDLSHDGIGVGDYQQRLEPFLFRYMEELDYEGVRFLLDSCHTTPSRLLKSEFLSQQKVVCLGYTNIAEDVKLSHIRDYAGVNDWTNEKSDEYMRGCIRRSFAYSEILKKECAELDIPYFDTSSSFNDVLDEAFQFLVENYG